jgi:uncharacterized protein (TIGR00251 family)
MPGMGNPKESDQIVTLRVKAVPGASRDSIAGMLGDRLKVRVSAPPEGGEANRAIVMLLAESLGVRPAQITLDSGRTSAEKVFSIMRLSPQQLNAALGLDASAAIG